MTGYDEEQLAELLRALPPAPPAWVQAAQELPQARAGIDALVERAEQDVAFRQALVADLEQTLRAVAEQRGLKAAVLIHATRLAMTGRTVSPGLFEMLRLLGRREVLDRLGRIIRSG